MVKPGVCLGVSGNHQALIHQEEQLLQLDIRHAVRTIQWSTLACWDTACWALASYAAISRTVAA